MAQICQAFTWFEVLFYSSFYNKQLCLGVTICKYLYTHFGAFSMDTPIQIFGLLYVEISRSTRAYTHKMLGWPLFIVDIGMVGGVYAWNIARE